MLKDAAGTLVSMEGVDKVFFGSYANRGVDFELKAGEVHALLGENGAGKTTLMNVLSGIYAADAGVVRVMGKRVDFRSPRDALRCGIGMIHQHFMLIPRLTVWENMILGETAPIRLDKKRTIEKIEELSRRYGMPVLPAAQVWQLSIGEQQRVEILKMLYRGTKILILDEPTSVLTPQETDELLVTLRAMADEGHGIVIISHKVEEILRVADRLTVLRKGEKVATVDAASVSPVGLAEMMVGRAMGSVCKIPASGEKVVLSVRGLCALSDRDLPALKDVSFDLREGEVLGVAAVGGNGSEELCETLAGLRRTSAGTIRVGGRDIAGETPRAFARMGIAYIPVDRKGVGLAANMDVTENVALRRYWQGPFFVDWQGMGSLAQSLVDEYGVATPSIVTPVRFLSGGNLQKLMLARELSDNPAVIIASNPVWGLDVGAAEFVRNRLLAAAGRGAGVLLTSEDLDELMQLADRIAVLYRGEIMGIVRPCDSTRNEIGLMMAGRRGQNGGEGEHGDLAS